MTAILTKKNVARLNSASISNGNAGVTLPLLDWGSAVRPSSRVVPDVRNVDDDDDDDDNEIEDDGFHDADLGVQDKDDEGEEGSHVQVVLGKVGRPPWSGFLEKPQRTAQSSPATWVPRFVVLLRGALYEFASDGAHEVSVCMTTVRGGSVSTVAQGNDGGVFSIMPPSATKPAMLYRAQNQALMLAWVDILNLAVLDSSNIRKVPASDREGLEEGLDLVRATGTDSLIAELQTAFEVLDTAFF